jgi:hypothetical protein
LKSEAFVSEGKLSEKMEDKNIMCKTDSVLHSAKKQGTSVAATPPAGPTPETRTLEEIIGASKKSDVFVPACLHVGSEETALQAVSTSDQQPSKEAAAPTKA